MSQISNETLNRKLDKLIALTQGKTAGKRMVKAKTLRSELPHLSKEDMRAIRKEHPHLVENKGNDRYLYSIEDIKKIA